MNEELRGAGEKRRGKASGQVRLTAAVVIERVEDTERCRSETDGSAGHPYEHEPATIFNDFTVNVLFPFIMSPSDPFTVTL